MLQIEAPNIFRGAGNDYNIRVMKCSKPLFQPDKFIREIACIIKSETGYDPLEKVKFRGRKNVEARQILSYFIHKHTDLTLREIGSWLGSNGHSNVLQGIKTLRNLRDTDRSFREIFERIETKVKLLK
jgi:hypothetical protein